MGQWSVPGRMSCNRKKQIQTNTFGSRGSCSWVEKKITVWCVSTYVQYNNFKLWTLLVTEQMDVFCVSVVAAWPGWGWRKWKGCWRRLNRKKPDWWRVVWVPLNFNCLWNVISLMNFKTDRQLPLLLQQWKFFSHLQRDPDMKDGLLTSSPSVMHILTCLLWNYFFIRPL